MQLPYGEVFLQLKIDGPTLLELTDDDLQKHLGIGNPLHWKKLIGHIKLLRAQAGRGSSPQSVLAPSSSGSPRPQARTLQDLKADFGGFGATPLSNSAGSRQQSPLGLDEVNVAVTNPLDEDSEFRERRSNGIRRSYSCDDHRAPPSPHGLLRADNNFFRGGPGASSSQRGMGNSLSTLSMATAMQDDHGIYSSYTNPDRASVVGLNSYFGIDSPSYSRRGSFQQAKRKALWAGCPGEGGPSALSYKVDRDRFLPSSPRATIGRSPRNTSEYVCSQTISPGNGRPSGYSAGPGPGKHAGSKPPSKVQGGTIGTAARWSYNGRNLGHWLTPRKGPGPSDYHPNFTFDSTFKR